MKDNSEGKKAASFEVTDFFYGGSQRRKEGEELARPEQQTCDCDPMECVDDCSILACAWELCPILCVLQFSVNSGSSDGYNVSYGINEHGALAIGQLAQF